jgi:hypothetical protein
MKSKTKRWVQNVAHVTRRYEEERPLARATHKQNIKMRMDHKETGSELADWIHLN